MYQYTVSQWILFFLWYCFIGWVWESCYVSIKEAARAKKWKWVNRGFLNGPALPIYGFAAIVILIATIPVKDNIAHIFCFGALAATLLELVTGSAMERMFHVKYWDYSNMPLNFHGYICFFVTLFWGMLSILLVKVIHVPVESLILQWSSLICEILAFLLLAVFTVDLSESFRQAWDMRELLEKLTECRNTIQRLGNRLDAVAAFSPFPDIGVGLRVKTGSAKEKMLCRLENLRDNRVSQLKKLSERLWSEEHNESKDREEILAQLEQQVRGVCSRTNKQFVRVTKHLRRNPGAISKRYAEALKEIKGLFEEKE